MFSRKSILIFLFILFDVLCQAQLKESRANKVFFDSIFSLKNAKGLSERNRTLNISKSGDSYQFMELRGDLGALNSIIFKTNDRDLINLQKTIIDNIINSSYVSSSVTDDATFNDSYKGWVSLKKDVNYHKEIVLFEGYSFFYITEFLFFLQKSGWTKNAKNRTWWNKTVLFIEDNIWNKWTSRSSENYGNKYSYFLRSIAHKTSHWAGIALYLNRISFNSKIKKECQTLINQYDLLLKRNLKRNSKVASAYVWNSTFDSVKGTYAIKAKSTIIQDVSHANHVVSYIVAAHEMGNKNWTIKELNALCSTLKNVIYNKQRKIFSDNVDGTNDKLRPGWGNFQADGWVKLSKYDNEVKELFVSFSKENKAARKYNQGSQFKINLRAWGKVRD